MSWHQNSRHRYCGITRALNISNLGTQITNRYPETAQVREVVCKLRKFGQIPVDENYLETKIDAILFFMRKLPSCIAVQRVGCHTISNIAMNLEAAEIMMSKGVHQVCENALKTFHEKDWRICWLACSAIWNLARSSQRNKFKLGTVDLIIKIAATPKRNSKPKVLNTCLGALSNLSLSSKIKVYIGSHHTKVRTLLQLLEDNADKISVASTGAGLFANLAVFDLIGEILVKLGLIRVLTKLLGKEQGDEIFLRNLVAALSNVITASTFIPECCLHRTVEAIYTVQQTTSNTGIQSLLQNCFENLEIDANEPTTSLHVMLQHRLNETLSNALYDNLFSETFLDLDARNFENQTILEVAAERQNYEAILVLLQHGANASGLEILDLPIWVEETLAQQNFLVSQAEMIYSRALIEFGKTQRLQVSQDIAFEIISFVNKPHLLHGTGYL